MPYEDETVEFWRSKDPETLAATAAAMHRYRREITNGFGLQEVTTARRVAAELFLQGRGVEVGAGDRRWPLPDGATCYYGDIRDHDTLVEHFHADSVEFDGRIDAQTFAGVPDASLDFVISGHVLEHLADPVGSIRETCRVLRPRGVFLIAVPDMRFTTDRDRPETTIAHLLADEVDGGASTVRHAYREHVLYVHPLSRAPIPADMVERQVDAIMAESLDIHFHAWTGETFIGLLETVSGRFEFTIEGHVAVQNERIVALRRI